MVAFVATAAFLTACTTTSPSAPKTAAAPEAASPTRNGVEELSADEILTKASAALGDARSFRITSKKTAPGGPLTVDETDVGHDFVRTLEFPTSTTVVIVVDGVYYIKLTETYLSTLNQLPPQADLTSLVGKYLQLHDSTAPVPVLGTGRYADDVKKQLSHDGTVTKGRITTINDQRVIEVVRAPEKTSIYLALDGEPYPLRIEVGWPPNTATSHLDGPEVILDISAFNQGQHIEAPAPEDRVDMNEIIARMFGKS